MTVSIIIPTLNEAACLAGTLAQLRQLRPAEIIVADGGSTDGTRAAAKDADQVIDAPQGRARQMNAGAAMAHGDVLLFLHADCTLETGALQAAERCLLRPGVAAGCFRQTVQAAGLLYRSIDACATMRVRMTGIGYGDQGLFLHSETFHRAGGFPDLRLMEDVFLCRALRRFGRMVVLSQRIFVSPRRWQRMGIVRQTLRNWTLTALALAGVSPNRLARYYPVVR